MEAQVDEIVTAKNLWLKSSMGKNYSYNITIQWIGKPNPKTYEVTVIDGKSSSTLPPELSTVQSLFKHTFEVIKRKNDNVKVSYDLIYGYPTMIKVIRSGLIDGSSTIKVTDFNFL